MSDDEQHAAENINEKQHDELLESVCAYVKEINHQQKKMRARISKLKQKINATKENDTKKKAAHVLIEKKVSPVAFGIQTLQNDPFFSF